MEKPLNNHCHMGTPWIVSVLCLHALYTAALIGFTGAIRHIEFKFHELKDLWRGILVSSCCIGMYLYDLLYQLLFHYILSGNANCLCSIYASIISFKGIWVVAYILNETHEDNSLVQIITRSLLLILVCYSPSYYYVIALASSISFLLFFPRQVSFYSRSSLCQYHNLFSRL